MSNWICDKCGATYIDVSHQEPSVLKQVLEIRQLKDLLKESREWIEYLEEIMLETENIVGVNYFQGLLTRIEDVLK